MDKMFWSQGKKSGGMLVAIVTNHPRRRKTDLFKQFGNPLPPWVHIRVFKGISFGDRSIAEYAVTHGLDGLRLVDIRDISRKDLKKLTAAKQRKTPTPVSRYERPGVLLVA
jgi:hypothetical protein